MQSTDEVLYRTQMRLYWERNAPLTCAVLVIVVVLSALVHPIGLRLFLGVAFGGVLVYLGALATDRNRALLGSILAISGLGIALWAMTAAGVIRGPLMWVQGIGIFWATNCACMVFAKAVRENPEGKQQ